MRQNPSCGHLFFCALLMAVVVGCSPASGSGNSIGATEVSTSKLIHLDDCLAGSTDGKVGVCHATGSNTNPYVHIRVSKEACSNGHSQHLGDFVSEDPNCRPVDATCGDTAETAGHSCRTIYESCGAIDGAYWINPSGVTGAAFRVYCRQGWALIAKLGKNASPTSDFSNDLETESLVDASPPARAEYSHWNLARFAAFGSNWTVRSDTDAFNNQTHYQYAFFTPRVSATCPPSLAGSNWKGSTTNSLLEHLTRSTTTGLQNHTWLAVPDCIGGHCDSDVLLWTYRLDSEGGDCLDSDGQTRICHSVQGAVATIGGPCGNGSMTAAFGMLDGVEHCWAKQAAYWLRDERAGAP
jgi:hypothetical protein